MQRAVADRAMSILVARAIQEMRKTAGFPVLVVAGWNAPRCLGTGSSALPKRPRACGSHNTAGRGGGTKPLGFLVAHGILDCSGIEKPYIASSHWIIGATEFKPSKALGNVWLMDLNMRRST